MRTRGGVRERAARGLMLGAGRLLGVEVASAAGRGGNHWSRLRSARSLMRRARCALSWRAGSMAGSERAEARRKLS